jgi:glycosyltransferase involved in cell wall biosynthesis
MNILFLTVTRFSDINNRGIYTDLLRRFCEEGHKVFVVTPAERKFKERVGLTTKENVSILKVRTLNIQKANFIEKGLGILLIEIQFLNQIKKYFSNIKFDLVLYSTPPITFSNAVRYIKNRDAAKTYLLLKDIFPQNAVDLKLISKSGPIYKYFRNKESELYRLSDHIGCMSPANVEFVIKHNSQINPGKVEINPNSIQPVLKPLTKGKRDIIRSKFNIPSDSIVFLYGGNLGKPQGIDFLISVLLANRKNLDIHFLIVGDGTEYNRISKLLTSSVANVQLMKSLAKDEYDNIILACDVGLIFLDKCFTIPNFPSRILSYMEARLPVLAATDISTDIGTTIEDNNFGLWSQSGDLVKFNQNLSRLLDLAIRKKMGENGHRFLINNYLVQHSYDKIISKF